MKPGNSAAGALGVCVVELASGRMVFLKLFHSYFCFQIIHVRVFKEANSAKELL